MSSSNENVMRTLSSMMEVDDGKLFEPYIRYLRFPQYKRLQPNSRIDFSFPITALVGPNGSNKSSILHALYGSPDQKSVGNYWFSTEVDRISKESRHCFIYGYRSLHNKRIVEVLKTRIQKPDNPDYWEPSRPIAEYNMEPMPPMADPSDPDRSKTRWRAIPKNVLYLDFRHDLPAFDRYFYHMPLKRTKNFKSKQDYIRKYSKNLHSIIVECSPEYFYRNVQRVRSNRILDQDRIEAINLILGRKYTKIQIVDHSLYGGQFAKTVVISGDELNYSEAFAGSGESSVIILVDEILSATSNSLILLDEPETSLHPEAQKKLMDFIAECVKKNHHQVVISTHSPFLINCLPPHAIKSMVLEPNGVRITPFTLQDEAFSLLGAEELTQKSVYVEDVLSAEIVKSYIRQAHPRLESAINVRALSGGAKTIIGRYIYSFSQAGEDKAIFLLDGDMNYRRRAASNIGIRAKISNYYDTDDAFCEKRIPESDNPNLDEIFYEITGIKSNTVFCPDGSNGSTNNQQKYQQIRDFLTYWFSHVYFFDGLTPEDAIISNLSEEERTILYSGAKGIEQGGKEVFRAYTQNELRNDDVTGSEILVMQKRFINRLELTCPLFRSVDKALSSLLSLK